MDLVNVSIGLTQRILGHESRKTTELYLHSIVEPERDAIKKLKQAREKSHTEK